MRSEDIDRWDLTSSFREEIIDLPDLTEDIGVSVHVEVHVEMLGGGGAPGSQALQTFEQVNKL